MLRSAFESLLSSLKAGARAVLDQPLAFLAIHGLNRVVFAAGRVKRQSGIGHRGDRRQGGRVLIVAPPGGGNIGDQALVESAVWNASGPVTLVVRSVNDFQIPDWLNPLDVEVVPLPELIYGLGAGHMRDVFELGTHTHGVSRVMLVGADIMDGNYNLVASLNRWSVTGLFGRASVPAAVLGFSWSDRARPSCLTAARIVNKHADLWLRDPVSQSRMVSAGVAGKAGLCADIVFAHPAPDLAASYRSLPAELHNFVTAEVEFVVLNMSGLVGSDADLIGHYVRVVERLRSAGISIILLPHVVRATKSDNVYLRDLAARFDDPGIILVNDLLTPSQVYEVCRGGLMVLTGRMHLAVLASLSGTPSSTLSTQGKVAGLYEHLRSPDGAIEVDSDVSRIFFERLEKVVDQTGGVSPELRRHLKELALKAFILPPFRSDAPEPVHSVHERAS
ncbi:polysaccharide pyruvyl transferase family protein [Gordonia sp. WA4-43]|uniref:polysaccharide pyruvyl transferase family protein n=1 Tax=Gordonia sp. WA4-43 TaxID=2878678 RepID=UPI001CF981BC|nr:polysaccharide pyruvyl transferase family protein [Gordonia sp. WA4-43]UCZ89417.1 polysaccharide pyruvyl transferase family protein [Gordonia sp. WA4-43]